jgi:AbiV family abortive infection protein
MTPFKPEVLQAIEACRSHAQDLYDGAILLRGKTLPNVAYHLATLALEELGKAQLIGMHSFAKDDADSWYTKQINDHVKKLFWALWGDVFGKRPDKKYLEELRGTATAIVWLPFTWSQTLKISLRRKTSLRTRRWHR